MKTQKRSHAQLCHDIINDFLAEHPEMTDWQMEDVAGWAIRQKRWQAPTRNAIKMCASDLAKAAREEYYTDPQGRRVRRKHARKEMVVVDGKPKQMVFWADIELAEPRHMRVSLQQRRQMVLADCAQLKRDTDSYNDNNPHGAEIQMIYDFAEDLFELELSSEYDGGNQD